VSIERNIQKRTERRAIRTRKNIRLSYKNDKVRVSCFRSLNHFYAQAIAADDSSTLASASTLKINVLGDKKSASYEVGKTLAEALKSKGIDTVILDRGSYLYHGRVASFAQGLRDNGIKL
jgi:large subunit ribosomal protein L18